MGPLGESLAGEGLSLAGLGLLLFHQQIFKAAKETFGIFFFFFLGSFGSWCKGWEDFWKGSGVKDGGAGERVRDVLGKKPWERELRHSWRVPASVSPAPR